MVSSYVNRIILIALLPVMALLLYIEGQKYDPALIQFTASDAGPGAEEAFFPGEIGAFGRAGRVRIFTRDNLYEYVNGHAEYFLSAGFEQLAVGEYIRTGADPDRPDVIVDIYDMGKGLQAFGVFADEAGSGSSAVQVGMMGARTEQDIIFVDGKYYVKITAFEKTAPIDEFAARIDRMIDSPPGEAEVFARLPDAGEVVATGFVKEAYRGLDFVDNVIERAYLLEGGEVQVSFVTGSEADLRKLLAAYLDFFRESGTVFTTTRRDDREVYKINDPYEGDWYLVPAPDAVFGIYGAAGEGMLDQLLPSIMKAE